jgi:hypothetical protein
VAFRVSRCKLTQSPGYDAVTGIQSAGVLAEGETPNRDLCPSLIISLNRSASSTRKPQSVLACHCRNGYAPN